MDETQRIVVAPDKFKGSLTAVEVTEIISSRLQEHGDSSWNVSEFPMADGGEGTVKTLVKSLDGQLRTEQVSDPLGRPIEATWGWIPPGDQRSPTAVIEMAAASGLDLLEADERNPLKTTTYGTGELIASALEYGAEQVILGIGGSATVDGGMGMAQALGFSFDSKNETSVGRGGGSLENVRTIQDDEVISGLGSADIRVACDVENPLLGDEGAAQVYGPQKGASSQEVERLEEGMGNWADCVERYRDRQIRDEPGSGAAGGLGFGLLGLLDADLQPGADLIMDYVGIDQVFQRADLVVTGEGKIDDQTAYGKTPRSVADRARDHGVEYVLGVAGCLGDGYEQTYKFLVALLPLPPGPLSEDESIKNAKNLLHSRSRDLSHWIQLILNSSSASDELTRNDHGGDR